MYFKKIGPDDYQLTVTGAELAEIMGYEESEMNGHARNTYGSMDANAIHSVVSDYFVNMDVRILNLDGNF